MGIRTASAGNITVTNNVILNGRTKQVEFYSYARPTSGYVGAGCPRSTIARNVFSFDATQTDAKRTGPTQPDGSKPMWEGGGVRAPYNHVSPNVNKSRDCDVPRTVFGAL